MYEFNFLCFCLFVCLWKINVIIIIIIIINKLHLSSLQIIGLIKFILDEKFFIDLKVGQILDAVDGPVFPPCMDQVSIKKPNPKSCRLYWCFIEFIDWRYSQ